MVDLSWWQRLQLRVFGKVKIGERVRPGWKAPIPLYAFNCGKHGLVENIPKGWWIEGPFIPVRYNGVISELRCPSCLEEKWKYA